MVTKSKTAVIDPDSELGRLLKDTDDGPRQIEHFGVRNRVERVRIIDTSTVEDLRAGYDPEAPPCRRGSHGWQLGGHRR